MGFNGLFEIPQLFMILVLASFYAYRKNLLVTYGLLIVFVAYYIQFALTMKILYALAMSITNVKDFLLRR
jgi:predicted branched-subunit amino acid permease